MRRTIACDDDCINVTRSHFSVTARDVCRAKRQGGEAARAQALIPRAQVIPVASHAGVNYEGRVVTDDLSTLSLWRPRFRDAVLDMPMEFMEGAHLPGADFRGVDSPEVDLAVRLYMLAEARGAIIDDEVRLQATQGEYGWLTDESRDIPVDHDARFAMDFACPFIQWSFSSSQWENLISQGFPANDLVEAAQVFPPLNEAGFEMFLVCGDAQEAAAIFPHRTAWGGRSLRTPPPANIQRVRALAHNAIVA